MIVPNFEPSVLSLLTTMYCTAKCRNCCFQCSPHRKEKMTLCEMKSYIDIVGKEFPTVKIVVFSGGECTSLKDDLLNSIQYAHENGFKTRIVTNAFWASSYDKAYNQLFLFKQYGLDEINYSTGDDHQEWVPYENIVNACLAARSLGFNVLVNVESHPDSSFNSSVFKNDIRISRYLGEDIFDSNSIKIMQGIWMPVDEQEKHNRIHVKVKPQYKACESLFETLAIIPNGDIYCCCGLTCLENPFLKVGNIHSSSRQEIMSNQFDDILKIWMHTEGPYKILEFLYKDNRVYIE